MKYKFQAIDSQGRVVRGVLSADSEDEAREFLLSEELFGKRFEEVDDSDAVTWAPKKLRMEKHQASVTPSDELKIPEGVKRSETVMHVGGKSVRGALAIENEDSILFESKDSEEDSRRIEKNRVERAELSGFPARFLRIYMIDGDLIEFSAGFLHAGPQFNIISKMFASTAA